MTIKQKQWQLYYLGYLYDPELPIDEVIDGIWGEKSQDATIRFQDDFGIAVDGIFGPNTENKSMEVIDAIQDVVSTYAPQPLNKAYWGLAGNKTMAATIWFQKAVGLTPTGIADSVTRSVILSNAGPEPQEKPENSDWWENIEFFDRGEFRCKCGGVHCDGFPAEPKEALVRLADDARRHFGAVVDVSSGVRCKTHNAAVGGVANSRHLTGKAMDFRVRGKTAAQVLAYVKTLPGVRYAYAINDTYVHMDVE